ncbi:hypothetical protein WA026_008049 [Henosepilachna vigintioctopunctata]|uniref:PDZ domain-containing protein n=1 Tax=Henosepilachna vigintioctopunctata TaxID=420089 RepID=A0AAW1TIH1_9CUCU
MSYQRPSFWQWRPSGQKKKVGFGSPADGVLQRGDIISKIGNYDARDIRHQDAQTLFKNSGNNVRIVVQRDVSQKRPTSTGSSRASSHNYSPLSVSPHLSPRGGYSNYSPGGSALTPYYSSPLTPIDDNFFDVLDPTHGSGRPHSEGEVHLTKQPYRTSPLVLPGAKVKREPGPTESYLRHHPNPAVRAAPHHIDTDHLYKQKVANSVLERISTGDPNKQIVHKQFNSPISLYSEPNVVETIHKQTGVHPIRKTVKFNPTESETYKAIQEEQSGQEVHEIKPAQTKVYTPQAKKTVSVNPQPAYSNSLGHDDVIHQSGSFRRLMLSVLPETSY